MKEWAKEIHKIVQNMNDGRQSEAKSIMQDLERAREKMFEAIDKLYIS